MQAHETDKEPKFNATKPDGVQAQADDSGIIAILIGGEWVPCVEGSFKYYVSIPNPEKKDRQIPFIQFDIPNDPLYGVLAGTRAEVFPQSVGGYVYRPGA
jgi:hypothetical protein